MRTVVKAVCSLDARRRRHSWQLGDCCPSNIEKTSPVFINQLQSPRELPGTKYGEATAQGQGGRSSLQKNPNEYT